MGAVRFYGTDFYWPCILQQVLGCLGLMAVFLGRHRSNRAGYDEFYAPIL